MTIIRLCASALFLIVLSDGYLDYPDLGCMDMDGICVPYSPGSKYYNNKFDIIFFFPDALRKAISKLSIKTQIKIASLKPKMRHFYISGKAKTTQDALGIFHNHIFPNETETLKEGLIFHKLSISQEVKNKITKIANMLLRAYYINKNRNSATVVMYILMELVKTPAFNNKKKADLMNQLSGFRNFMKEPATQDFINNYYSYTLKKRVDMFIEVIKQCNAIPNPKQGNESF